MSTPKFTKLSWDWKESPSASDFQSLAQFGVYAVDDPKYDGSDCVGVIFSDRPLTAEELAAISENDE